jgi:hypothetical protein
MANQDMLDEMAEATEEFKADLEQNAEVEQQVSDPEPADITSDDDIEVPSFLDEDDEDGDIADSNGEEVETEAPESTPPSNEDVFEYTANGETFSATRDEAIKALSLMKGARKAFSDRARLSREKRQWEKKEKPELLKYKEYWEKVMDDNPHKVFENLTGQKFDDILDKEVKKRQMLEYATPEEKRLIEYEDRISSLTRQQEAWKKEQEERQSQFEQQQFQSEVENLNSIAQPLFDQYSEGFSQFSEARQNKLGKMLWRNTIRDVQDAVRDGHKVSRRLVNKLFKDNASAILDGFETKVQEGVQQSIKQHSSQAKAKAQAASQQNYNKVKVGKELTQLNPADLFRQLTRKKG